MSEKDLTWKKSTNISVGLENRFFKYNAAALGEKIQ